MKFIAVIVAGLLCSTPAFADDFGPRFTENTPVALQDQDEAIAQELAPQDIEPAAGDTQNSTALELEQKFDTEVSHTGMDRGAGDFESHDSVGEGDVRLFYQNEQEGRVMDNQDSIGVEMKLIEFD